MIAGLPKGGNDVIWGIFDSAGTLVGESAFHMSCSDDDMDGPKDCGLRSVGEHDAHSGDRGFR